MWLVSCCTEKNQSFTCGSFNTQSRMFTHLVEDFLQVGGTHTVSQVSVGGMWEKELSLSSHSSSDVFLSIDVLLAPVHHTDVTWKQGFARVPLWWSSARVKLMTWNFFNKPKWDFYEPQQIIWFEIGSLKFTGSLGKTAGKTISRENGRMNSAPFRTGEEQSIKGWRSYREFWEFQGLLSFFFH